MKFLRFVMGRNWEDLIRNEDVRSEHIFSISDKIEVIVVGRRIMWIIAWFIYENPMTYKRFVKQFFWVFSYEKTRHCKTFQKMVGIMLAPNPYCCKKKKDKKSDWLINTVFLSIQIYTIFLYDALLYSFLCYLLWPVYVPDVRCSRTGYSSFPPFLVPSTIRYWSTPQPQKANQLLLL